MAPEARDGLIKAAASLAKSDTTRWKEFLAALEAYSQAVKDGCIQSPLDRLPNAQGQAQACVALLGILRNCVSTADKIQDKHR